MKRALLAATAMLSSSFISTAAWATDLGPASSQPTLTTEDAYCQANFITDDTHYVETIQGTTATGNNEEVPGTRQADESSRVGDPNSQISYSGLIGTSGALVRIGGSPNMFAAGTYSQKNYSASFVDYYAMFSHTDTYPFTCRQWTDTITPEVITNPGSGNPGVGNCVGDPHKKDAIDGVGPGKGAENQNPHGACSSGTTIYHHDWSYVDSGFSYTYTPPAVGPLKTADSPVSEQVPTFETGSFTPGDWYGVACISPSKTGPKGNPGTWTKKASYGGPGTCNTTTFNSATTVFGNVFDNPIPSNSLPTN